MTDDVPPPPPAARPTGLLRRLAAWAAGLFAPHPPDAVPPTILTRLPPDLHYLIAPALKYGRHQFDEQIFAFLDRATAAEKDELRRTAERHGRRNDAAAVNAFLDEYPIDEYEDAARLYFLFGVMDHAGLDFESAPDGPDGPPASPEAVERPAPDRGAGRAEEPSVRWDVVPEAFQYLREAVDACGEVRVARFDEAAGRHVPPIERLSGERLDLIEAARAESRRRGDRAHIEAWCSPPERPKPSVVLAQWRVGGMLFLFDEVDAERARRRGRGAR